MFVKKIFPRFRY